MEFLDRNCWILIIHDDVIKWKHFPRYRPFVRGIHLDVFVDLRLNKRLSKQSWGWWFGRHHAHYDVTVMGCHLCHQCLLYFIAPWGIIRLNELTHWGRAKHPIIVCVNNLTIIGSDNGLSPGRTVKRVNRITQNIRNVNWKRFCRTCLKGGGGGGGSFSINIFFQRGLKSWWERMT